MKLITQYFTLLTIVQVALFEAIMYFHPEGVVISDVVADWRKRYPALTYLFLVFLAFLIYHLWVYNRGDKW